MLARVRSAAVLGIDAYLVEVETDIANGLPTFACLVEVETDIANGLPIPSLRALRP
jgi:magnesium chelatase family protein